MKIAIPVSILNIAVLAGADKKALVEYLHVEFPESSLKPFVAEKGWIKGERCVWISNEPRETSTEDVVTDIFGAAAVE
jgi:hypothetical protein